jgi:hypothetical protein
MPPPGRPPPAIGSGWAPGAVGPGGTPGAGGSTQRALEAQPGARQRRVSGLPEQRRWAPCRRLLAQADSLP